jgi:hypothetical protein
LLVRDCADWLGELGSGRKPVVNLRPPSDWPDTDNVIVNERRIQRILRRIAGDVEELARARRAQELSSATVDRDPRLGRRRRFGEPPIESPKGPMSVPQARRAWGAYERQLKRAGLPIPENPYRHFARSAK